MITTVSHFNEKNTAAIEDICSQNVSPTIQMGSCGRSSFLSHLTRFRAWRSVLWVLTRSSCLHPLRSVLLLTPLRTVSMWLMWLKFKINFENQTQIIFINDTFLLFSFLSVLIALELITTLALKIKSSFSQTTKSHRMPNQTLSNASFIASLPPHTHRVVLFPFSLEISLPDDFIWSQMISSTICMRIISKSTFAAPDLVFSTQPHIVSWSATLPSTSRSCRTAT